jgi:hypothetical protein
MRYDHHKCSPDWRHQGEWSWNQRRLESKIITPTDPDECTEWLGALSPTGALLGARKNSKPQMTQARRLVWMGIAKESLDEVSITLSCHNQACCNPRHFVLAPNKWNGYHGD